jgi:hypothetical protein
MFLVVYDFFPYFRRLVHLKSYLIHSLGDLYLFQCYSVRLARISHSVV